MSQMVPKFDKVAFSGEILEPHLVNNALWLACNQSAIQNVKFKAGLNIKRHIFSIKYLSIMSLSIYSVTL